MGIRSLPAIGALGLAAALLVPISQLAAADDPPTIEIENGVTAPVFDYADAIRERVFIPVAGVDQDGDGENDRTAIEIIRPRESDAGLKVPAIIDPSPYYTTLGRGNESEKIQDLDGDGLNDKWPTYYDNYFVPRGYAMILAEMDGTAHSTGCPMHGGPGDIASMRVVVDWLQGRVPGYDASGAEVVADWDNGKAAMIGKSYDGTLANGVAATGVAGLTTIVPISAISDWYAYSRTGGIRFNTHYPANLANAVTDPPRRSACLPSRNALSAADGDATGDRNGFWDERDYLRDADKVEAAVFAVHGINDDNVRMDHFARWWSALAEHDVPRKVWLSQEGHVDPFDFRRAEWVDTLHRWFDHWLQGIDNGVMSQPRATIETAADVFEDRADWPLPGTTDVALSLGVPARDPAPDPGTGAGRLLLQPDHTTATRSFTDPTSNPTEATMMASPEGSQANRLVFLSEPLSTDLRISGTPRIDLRASLDKEQSNLGALLVDYGTGTRVPRTGEGVQNTATRTCWGEESVDDKACYLEVSKRQVTGDVWRVSKGVLDSANRDSLYDAEPVTPGQVYRFRWPTQPTDYTFAAGHRIGVVLVANFSSFPTVKGTTGAQVTVDTTASTLVLPVLGGLDAAADSEGLGDPAPVTLSFDLGGHGIATPDRSVPWDEAPGSPPAPTETGWTFDGWFTDGGFGTPFDFTAPMRDSATAYARWSRETHQVGFDLGGHGAAIPAQVVEYGDQATEPADPVAADWVFRGWYEDAALSTPFDFSAPVTSDRTAHAAWSAVTAAAVSAAPSTIPVEFRQAPLVARVTTVDPDAPTPRGSVRFLLDGSPLGVPVAVGTDGVARVRAPGVPAGSHALRAEFLPATGWEPVAAVGTLGVVRLLDAVRSVRLTASSTVADQGDTITVVADGYDRYGVALGEVTSLTRFSSSVAGDVVRGNRITFRHASRHVITGRIAASAGSIAGQVGVRVRPSVEKGEGGQGPGQPVPSGLPNTGSRIPPLVPPLGAGLVLLGAVLAWRHRGSGTPAD